MPAFTPGYISDWNKNVPSGSSDVRHGDDLLRSDKSIVEAAFNAEHYFNTDSASSRSAGEHRPGSAKIFYGAESALSNPEPGRVMYISDTTDLGVATSHSSWSQLGLASVGKQNIFSVAQQFNSGAYIAGSELTFGTDVNLYRQAANILRTDDSFWASEVSTPTLSIDSLALGGGGALSYFSSVQTFTSAVTVATSSSSELFYPGSPFTNGDFLVGHAEATAQPWFFRFQSAVDSNGSLRIKVVNDGGVTRSSTSMTVTILGFRFA